METAVDYRQYCWYRLPCGICTRTNTLCPLSGGTVQVTWTNSTASTATGTGYLFDRPYGCQDVNGKGVK